MNKGFLNRFSNAALNIRNKISDGAVIPGFKLSVATILSNQLSTGAIIGIQMLPENIKTSIDNTGLETGLLIENGASLADVLKELSRCSANGESAEGIEACLDLRFS